MSIYSTPASFSFYLLFYFPYTNPDYRICQAFFLTSHKAAEEVFCFRTLWAGKDLMRISFLFNYSI